MASPLQLWSCFDIPGRRTLHPLTDLEGLGKHSDSALLIKAEFERIQGSFPSDPPTLAVHIRPNWIISVYLLILHICRQGRVESRSSSPRVCRRDLASPRCSPGDRGCRVSRPQRSAGHKCCQTPAPSDQDREPRVGAADESQPIDFPTVSR